jgi:hypothetical protein
MSDLLLLLQQREARGDAVGWGTALQAGRSRVRFPMDGPGVDLASNKNEY